MSRRRASALIRTLPVAVRGEVSRVLFTAGSIVATEAQISITAGATSARGQHQPSLPGEAPNNDTGRLADGIEVTQPEPLKVQVTSTMPYSLALELGTSRMAERPFMRPAADKSRVKVNALVAKAARRAIKRHMGRG